jgi:hypothetical protein
MAKEFYLPLTKIKVDRFLFLLLSLLFLFVLHPFMEELIGLRLLMDAFVTLILISGVYAVSEKKSVFILALALALPTVAGSWSVHFLESPAFHLMGKISGALFFAFTAITLMSHLFKAKDITSDTIIGAICVYFLIGLMWAYVYAILEIFHPGTFYSSQGGSLGSQLFTYYSFVTITTLGYGDITPLTSQARSLSLIEAAFGQIYLAVVIARLVGIHITQSIQGK